MSDMINEEEKIGKISIADGVVASIAGIAAIEVEGVSKLTGNISKELVAKLGKKYGAKTIAFAGSVMKEAVACNEAGIDAFFPIVRGISTLEEAMDPDTAKVNMAAAAEQVFRLL